MMERAIAVSWRQVVRMIATVSLCAFLGACTTNEQPLEGGADGAPAQEQALALYSTDGTTLVVYMAPMELLTPANLAKMDAGEFIGTTWTRVEVPASLGSFGLAGAGGSSFRQEAFSEHPYTGELVPILLDFVAGDAGLQGNITVVDDGAELRTSFDVEFKGDYTLFPDIGPKWLEFSASQDWITADDPEAP